ncbi:MAG: hypothetical protein FE834_07005 [Gammaproteobacteria bacterium]|nr:hypothetical protein [Gammaproteobacteria bacterium]
MNDNIIEIGYMGKLKLTHGYQAANKFLEEFEAKRKGSAKLKDEGYHSHDAVVEAIMNEEIELGVIAIENSYEGMVADSARLLRDNMSEIRIVCELRIPIKHYLVTRCNDNEQIKKIYSHPVAYGQCKSKIEALFPNLEKNYFDAQVSTEQAATKMLANNNNAAAIVTEEAANKDNYPQDMNTEGLQTIKSGNDIADVTNLCTRFLVLEKRDRARIEPIDPIDAVLGADKRATAVFTLNKKKPGELLRVFGCLGVSQVPVAYIFPCPIKNCDFEYNFLVDCDLYSKDSEGILKKREFAQAIQNYNAFSDTKEKACILGQYPVLG